MPRRKPRLPIDKTKKRPKRSNACYDLERAYAEDARQHGFVQAERVTRGDDWGESTFDVRFPEVPQMITDTKYRKGGWAHHTVYETEVEAKYLKRMQKEYPDAFCVMPTKAGSKTGYFVSLRDKDWWRIMQLAFLNNHKDSSVWKCPRCSKPIEPVGKVLKQTVEYACGACKFRFVTQEKPRKEVES